MTKCCWDEEEEAVAVAVGVVGVVGCRGIIVEEIKVGLVLT